MSCGAGHAVFLHVAGRQGHNAWLYPSSIDSAEVIWHALDFLHQR